MMSSVQSSLFVSYRPFRNVSDLSDRIGNHVQVVLIGEASHGTSDFYELRSELTKLLIAERGFNLVACEADWPDMDRVDRFINSREVPGSKTANLDGGGIVECCADALSSFKRFPTWMWRNEVFREFADWARRRVKEFPELKLHIAGLDLYSLFGSIDEVLRYLETVDPKALNLARHFYSCFLPFNRDPQMYALQTALGIAPGCKEEAIRVLVMLLNGREQMIRSRLETLEKSGESERELLEEMQFKATINAVVAKDAEEYYRSSMFGGESSWNLRDDHMVDVIQRLMDFQESIDPNHAPRVVVWAHNSHLGDASQTEMGSKRGQHNIGQLCRSKFGEKCFIIGQLSHTGTVMCSSDWDSHQMVKEVMPSVDGSWENILHHLNVPIGILDCREERTASTKWSRLEMLERYIGVIYRPDSELVSHYCRSRLIEEYDLVIFHDHTRALKPC